MPPALRRLVAVAFAVLVSAGAAGINPAPTRAADLTVDAAEAEMVRLLNAERARHGLLKVRVDPRLMTIARQRSADMARRDYFSHTQPDGRTVFDLIRSDRITWFGAGEIIAWNNARTLAESAPAARDGWMRSPGHRAIVLSNSYNYFGVGLALDPVSGRRLWTGVFLKGPDLTGGWAAFGPPPTLASAAGSRYRDVTLSWTGGDVELVTLTAGPRDFQLRIRIDAGPWTTWSPGTTSRTRFLRAWRGHVYEVGVRACDRAANCGAWVYQQLQA